MKTPSPQGSFLVPVCSLRQTAVIVPLTHILLFPSLSSGRFATGQHSASLRCTAGRARQPFRAPQSDASCLQAPRGFSPGTFFSCSGRGPTPTPDGRSCPDSPSSDGG